MIIFILLLCDLLLTVVGGFVFSEMWEWFISPLGVPIIGVAQSVGIMFIANLINPLHSEKDPDVTDLIVKKVVRIALCYFGSLIIVSVM